MKDAINRIDRQFGYSNEVLAHKLGVSAKTIHKHRKERKAIINRAIYSKFFMKRPKLPKDIKVKSISNVVYTRFELVLIVIRKFFIRVYNYVLRKS